MLQIDEKKQNGTHAVIHVKQTKFEANATVINETALWSVPLDYVTENDDRPLSIPVLTKKGLKIYVPIKKPDDWILFNPDWVGYYRIMYSEPLLDRLKPAIKHKTIRNVDRALIQNDLCYIAKAGYTDTLKWFDLLKYYVDEDDYYVWKSLLDW